MAPSADQPALQVQLSVRQGCKAIEFYRGAFDAQEVYRFGGTEGHEDVVCQLRVHGALFWVEARHQGWLGEVTGLEISLHATGRKLEQLDEIAAHRSTIAALSSGSTGDAEAARP